MDKLYEISAENLGSEFMSFTLMLLSQMVFEHELHDDNLSPALLKNGILYLPQQAVTSLQRIQVAF